MLDDQEFEEKIVPCIVKLFESNDRATRLLLLNQIELYSSMYSTNKFSFSIKLSIE
jgi:SCY1-like protein 1